MNYENMSKEDKEKELSRIQDEIDIKEKELYDKKCEMEDMNEDIHEKQKEINEFDPSDLDLEDQYDEWLDECYFELAEQLQNFVNITPSELLKEHDPIAYNCGIDDYLNGMELDDFEEYRDLTDELGNLENELDTLETEAEEIEADLNDLYSEFEAIKEI